jgi:hypothetical protein
MVLGSMDVGCDRSGQCLGLGISSSNRWPVGSIQVSDCLCHLVGLSILATFFLLEWAVTGGGKATKNVFNTMLSSVLRAPLLYFEMVPMGCILIRFTYDTDVNDVLEGSKSEIHTNYELKFNLVYFCKPNFPIVDCGFSASSSLRGGQQGLSQSFVRANKAPLTTIIFFPSH